MRTQQEFENIIGEAWRKVLKIESVGANSNFFDLGGDSLRLLEVHLELERLTNTSICIMDLFQYSTIRALAMHLAVNASAHASFESRAGVAKANARDRAEKQRATFANQAQHRIPSQ